MANSYTQNHIQLIFAVKYRAALIQPSWKPALNKFISGLIQDKGHKLLQINGVADHIHILVGMRPYQSISSLVQDVKSVSSKWINEKGYCNSLFHWQGGFGAFSYTRSDVDTVIRYIQNQEAHHRKETFLEEYRRILQKLEIDYKEEYLFTEPV